MTLLAAAIFSSRGAATADIQIHALLSAIFIIAIITLSDYAAITLMRYIYDRLLPIYRHRYRHFHHIAHRHRLPPLISPP